MKKKRIILAIAMIAMLCAAFFWGGDFASKTSTQTRLSAPSEDANISAGAESGTPACSAEPSSQQAAGTSNAGASLPASDPSGQPTAPIAASPGQERTANSAPPASTNAPVKSPAETGAPAAPLEETDHILSERIPGDNPEPVEWQDITVNGDVKLSCTLSVSCATLLDNTASLDEAKLEILPSDGIIYSEQTVTFYEGESVFNVLQREMKANGVHMEFSMTPLYNSNYIEGIGNIYEYDCGELSGWVYRVNGWFPNYGCSRYLLADGDLIEWVYTCDLGRDVGGNNGARGSES